MVTQDMLEQLRAGRSTLDYHLDLTPDNAAYADIGAKLDQQRERNIQLAQRAMRDAQRDIRREYGYAHNQGFATAQFNQNSLDIFQHYQADRTQTNTHNVQEQSL